ncbi:hypothetical protein Tco_0078880 [Tanacetum coccineum]
MQKKLALPCKVFQKALQPTNNNLKLLQNSRNKTEDTTPRYNNDNQSGQFRNQRTMTVAGTRETVGTEQGVPLQAEQADWLADTDEEIDEQEIGKHIYSSWQRNSGGLTKEPSTLNSHWNR